MSGEAELIAEALADAAALAGGEPKLALTCGRVSRALEVSYGYKLTILGARWEDEPASEEFLADARWWIAEAATWRRPRPVPTRGRSREIVLSRTLVEPCP